MKKDKNKSKQIYGDNDQVKYDLLMSKEDEINKLVDTVTDKTLKKRATLFKKQKKVKDTSMNTGKTNKNKPLEDMDKEVFDMAGDGVDNAIQIAENTTNKKNKKKKDKSVSEKPKKKRGLKIFGWIFVILLILSGGYIGYQYLNTNGYLTQNSNTSIVGDIPNPTEIPETVNSEYQAPSVSGKLTKIDLMKEYSVQETLALADEFNETLIGYYNSFINETKNANYNVDIVSQVARNMISMVQEDIITLNDYMNVFINLKGDYYMHTALRRYENLNQLLSDVLSKTDEYQVQETINTYIQEENYLSGDSKSALTDFLSENGVQYEDSGEYITFDLIIPEAPVEQTEDTPSVEEIPSVEDQNTEVSTDTEATPE